MLSRYKVNCLLYKISFKTQLDANILLLLPYGHAFCINNPLHIQPSVEFNGEMGKCFRQIEKNSSDGTDKKCFDARILVAKI